MPFFDTAVKVLLMLAYALPGFVFVKLKLIRIETTSDLSKILLYVCQPMLELYSFNKVIDSADRLAGSLGIFLLVTLAGQAILIFILYLIFRKKYVDSSYRILCLASVFGNMGFFGTPLLETLLPQYPDAVVYSAVFAVSMNVVAWTLGLFIMTGDPKYQKPLGILKCPNVAALVIILPLFFTKTPLPEVIAEPVSLISKMSLPICMFSCGMRLAASDLKAVFSKKSVYISSLIKLVIFPLIVYFVTYFLPIAPELRTGIYLLCCCPSAAIVQSLAEIYDGDRSAAAASVLVANVLCAISIPVMCLLV